LKKLTHTWIIFFQLILEVLPVYSQYYTGTSLHTSDGLPTSELLCIERDRKGYLWIGSNVGITKYDGYSFETFRHSTDNQPIGKVNSLKEDRQQRLWIGTDAGLFLREGNSIRKFSMEAEKTQGVSKIFEDSSSNILLATEQGPVCIPKKITDTTAKVQVENYILPEWTKMIKGTQRLNLIAKARDGTLYFSSNFRLYRYYDNVLEELYKDDDAHDIIIQIIPVNKNKVIFYCGHSAWHKIENGIHTKMKSKDMLKRDSGVNGPNEWVLGSRTIYKFDALYETISSIIELGPFNALWVSDMLADPQNIIWITTHDGLVKLQPTVFKPYPANKFPLVQEIHSMYETSRKQLIMGGNRGKLINVSGDEVFEFSPLSPVVPLAEIKAMLEDDNGWLWMATGYEGVVVYHDGKKEHLTVKDGLRDGNNNFLYKTSMGNLFAMGDMGLTEIIVSGMQKSISFKNYFLNPMFSQHATLNGCAEGPGNILWSGGIEGLYYLSKDSLSKYNLTDRRISITDIKTDSTGDLWIVTEGDGIFHCKFNAKNLPVVKQHFTTKEGLNTDLFMKIFFDKEGNRWLTSYKGISYISKDGAVIANYDGSDGFLSGGFYNLFLYEDFNGRIWAGCSKGITSFDPVKITEVLYVPPAYITQVSLTNSGDDIFNYALKGKEGLPEKLNLPYNRNYIRFQYTAIDYKNQQNLQYYYQLSGLDTTWINGGNLRSVIYQHLSPGNYNFNVKAKNNKGVWSKTATYVFTIKSPFYKTGWFIILIVLTIILVTGLIIYFAHRIQLQRILMTQKVRNSIASDLHDDIGSSLSSIMLMSEMAEKQPKLASGYLTQITDNSRTIIENMNDIVWAINPDNDTVAQIVVRMQSFAAALLEKKNITLQFEAAPEIETLKLGMKERRNFYLIFKETIHNAVKYASCNWVKVKIEVSGKMITLKIEDDGKGFDTAKSYTGNGLRNLQKRAGEIQGDLQLISSPDNGTSVLLSFKTT
jgi:ligand-binding sensor domain-containing protein/signal transduction histidine kinase